MTATCGWCGKDWPANHRHRYVTAVQPPLPFLELARYREPGDPLHLCASTRACSRRRRDADEAAHVLAAVAGFFVLGHLVTHHEAVAKALGDAAGVVQSLFAPFDG